MTFEIALAISCGVGFAAALIWVMFETEFTENNPYLTVVKALCVLVAVVFTSLGLLKILFQ